MDRRRALGLSMLSLGAAWLGGGCGARADVPMTPEEEEASRKQYEATAAFAKQEKAKRRKR